MDTEIKRCYYNVQAAAEMSLSAGVVAGVFVYLVNGQHLTRAAIASALWVAIGWYSGKAIFPRNSH